MDVGKAGYLLRLPAAERVSIPRLSAYLAVGAIVLPGTAVAAGPEPTSAQLAGQAEDLVDRSVESWHKHQLPDGSFEDPVVGRVRNYGSVMIGQAMATRGLALNRPDLIHAGIQAEADQVNHPTYGSFERFALAEAYIWNKQNLTGTAEWQTALPQFKNFLSNPGSLTVGEKAKNCFALASCWNNLKLIQAYANIKLLETGLADAPQISNDPNAAVAGDVSARLTRESRTLLGQAVQNTGNDAEQIGRVAYGNAGINSDPSTYPLAYHALVTLMMGKTIENLGPDKTPAGLRQAFMRGNRALIGLMSPDGDIAYMGRGQGQVWGPAVAADSLALAARNTNDPAWRARYLAGASRAINRLETLYTPADWGVPLVPRLTKSFSPNYHGVDGYANGVMYDGFKDWALLDTASNLRSMPDTQPGSIPADSQGVLLDPVRSKLAAVRKGKLWWAIHGADSHSDARYDFGVIAALRRVNGRWIPALPYKPLTEEQSSGGPVLISNGQIKVPVSTAMGAEADGTVTVSGGWSAKPGGKPAIDTRTKWIFEPLSNDGIRLKFLAHKHRRFGFGIWYTAGSHLRAGKKSLEVIEPSGRGVKYRFNLPVRLLKRSNREHSAYDENLQGITLTAKTGKKRQTVRFDTLFK